MPKKDLTEWQELRKKLLENYFFYRDACEIDRIAVWPLNLAKYVGVSKRMAEDWLKGLYKPNSRHLLKIKEYCDRLKPLPELPLESKKYLQDLLKIAEQPLKSLKINI